MEEGWGRPLGRPTPPSSCQRHGSFAALGHDSSNGPGPALWMSHYKIPDGCIDCIAHTTSVCHQFRMMLTNVSDQVFVQPPISRPSSFRPIGWN